LNNRARQEDVKQVIGICKSDLVCFQETKMEEIPNASVRSSHYQDNCV
jgi:exonuclease III